MPKTCCTCRVSKPHSDYNRRARSRDGLQQVCRACSAAFSRRYYLNNTEAHRAATQKRRVEKRKEFKQRLNEIKQRFGCRVCGESDVVCLDFHHLDPKSKDFEIGTVTSNERPWEMVLAEIRKCVCLCANCHRKVHAGRFKVTEPMLCDV
jgi:transcription elongation factor Elf1